VLDSSGRLNLAFTIPPPLIQRFTNVIVQAAYFPSGFNCDHTGRTMTFTVDPRSTIQVTNAAGGHGGFPDLPQSLIPTFEVAFDTPGWGRLSSAVQTMCGLQRMSSVLLRPTVVPLKIAADNQAPLLLVSAADDVPAGMNPPLQYQGGSMYRVNDASRGRFTMSSQLASLQVFDETSKSRTVVLASTSGSWLLMDRLFTALGNTSQVWTSLTGDVAVIGPTGNLVNLTVAAGGPQLFTVNASNYDTAYAGIAAVFLLLLLVLGVWAVLRYRHRAAAAEEAEGLAPGDG
jgi:hypothetical protein